MKIIPVELLRLEFPKPKEKQWNLNKPKD